MAVPEKSIRDLEYLKFLLDNDGEVAVNVSISGGQVESAPVGLSTDFKVTTFLVTDVQTKLPPTVLTDRNFMVVINKDELETIYVGKTGVVAGDAIGTTAGMDVPAGETFNIAIKGNVEVELYAITEAGKTALVKVVEVS